MGNAARKIDLVTTKGAPTKNRTSKGLNSKGLRSALHAVSILPPILPDSDPIRASVLARPIKKKTENTLKGDLTGGLTAAVISLPLALAFGVAAFEPLGPEYASFGALSGLTAAIVGCFFASLLGGTPVQITTPTGPMTVVTASVVASLVAAIPNFNGSSDQIQTIATLTFFTVLLGGLVQTGLGFLNVGKVIRFIPHPVVAGFMNGIALIILFGQLPFLLGFQATIPWNALWAGETLPSIPTIAVGVFTIAVILLAPKFTTKLPASLIGLASGVGLFYLLQFSGFQMGDIVGRVPSALPTPSTFIDFLQIPTHPELLHLLPIILTPAVTLGILGSIDSLLTSVVADVATETHHDSRRELFGQGVANIISSGFGGVASAGTTVATLVNVNAGGTSRRSGIIHSIGLLLVLLVAAPLAGKIPLSVLAATLIVTAIQMIDGWSKRILFKFTRDVKSKKNLLFDLAVITAVMVITVAVDLMVAVGIGFVIACLIFVTKMGRDVVRRIHYGTERRSLKERSYEEWGFLKKEGHRIAILELDGALFFGSSGKLIEKIEHHIKHVDYFILDVHHLTEIDATGAKSLMQIHKMLQKENKEILISHLSKKTPAWKLLKDFGEIEVIGEKNFFPDTDSALEYAEDNLLIGHHELKSLDLNIPFNQMHIVRDFSVDEKKRFRKYLVEEHYMKNEILIEQGEASRHLIILKEGLLSVHVWNSDEERYRRIVSITPGFAVGEQAFVEGVTHSSNVKADTKVTAYLLSIENFEKMSSNDPELTMKLLFNISRELSSRLRKTTELVIAIDC